MKANEVLEKKYKTYDFLKTKIIYFGIYTLYVVVIACHAKLFFSTTSTSLISILVFVFYLLYSVYLILLSRNRKNSSTNSVIQNIKRQNILEISLIHVRAFFLFFIIPLSLTMILLLISDNFQNKSENGIVILFGISIISSISVGISHLFRKKVKIKNLKIELKEINELLK